MNLPRTDDRAARAPLVSVIIPAYNVAKYIEATLQSLRAQTHRNLEIIVVDDASTDDTVAVVERWADSRMRLVRHSVNSGVAVARNTALDQARGRYIAHLDPDDVAYPQRMARQVEALDADPTLGMLGAADAVMDESGTALGYVWRHPSDPVEANVGMFFENSFSTSTLMMRTEAIAGQRYLPVRISEDYEFNARIARGWKVANLDEPLVWRRRRGNSLTATLPEQMHEVNRRIIREHLQQLRIVPTDREVELSLHIGKKHLGGTLELLDEIAAWLARLCTANVAAGSFDQSSFSKIMARKWFDVCSWSAPMGPAAMWRFMRGDLASSAGLSGTEWLKFAAKCLLRTGGRRPSVTQQTHVQ